MVGEILGWRVFQDSCRNFFQKCVNQNADVLDINGKYRCNSCQSSLDAMAFRNPIVSNCVSDEKNTSVYVLPVVNGRESASRGDSSKKSRMDLTVWL